VGTASWLDRALLASGRFYPRLSMSGEERLRWYARFFDTVEVNSSYYALPSARAVAAWAARTPPGFRFHVKAYGLMTGHHPALASLPADLRLMLPASVPVGRRGEVDAGRFPPEALDRCFALFRDALRPLAEARKLGYVLFQLAPWVGYGEAALAYLASLRRRLPGWDVAVELRNASWVPARTEEVVRFLAAHELAYVSVDAAWQPAVDAATTPGWAVLRLHGRNREGWLAQRAGRAPTVAEKYDYRYGPAELQELADRARRLSRHAGRVAVTFNNNNEDFPVQNALDLKRLLGLPALDVAAARRTWRRPPARAHGPGNLFADVAGSRGGEGALDG
jgi:uncharacterized protein YecE (DUF72 family)